MTIRSKLLEEDEGLRSFEAWLQHELALQSPENDEFTKNVIAKITHFESQKNLQDGLWTRFSLVLSVCVISFLLYQNLDQQVHWLSIAAHAKNTTLTFILVLSCWQLLIELEAD